MNKSQLKTIENTHSKSIHFSSLVMGVARKNVLKKRLFFFSTFTGSICIEVSHVFNARPTCKSSFSRKNDSIFVLEFVNVF